MHKETVRIQVIIGMIVIIGASIGGRIFTKEKIRLTGRLSDADNNKRKVKEDGKRDKSNCRLYGDF